MYLPRMKNLEAQFVHYTGVYPDVDLPVCERFALNYSKVPELAEISLSSDLTPLFKLAYEKWEGQRLLSMLDVARLRFHLYDQIYRNNLCFTHTKVYEQTICEFWANRLLTKATNMDETRRQGDRIRKGKIKALPKALWLN